MTSRAYGARGARSPRSHYDVITFRVSRIPQVMYCSHARLCVCLSVCVPVCVSVRGRMPTLTSGSGMGCPLVVHYWADLQSVHGLCCYGNTIEMRGRAQRQSARPTARRTHATHAHCACRRRLPSPAIKWDAPAACAVPFRPYSGGVVTRTLNVSEYMLVLALCLVRVCTARRLSNGVISTLASFMILLKMIKSFKPFAGQWSLLDRLQCRRILVRCLL